MSLSEIAVSQPHAAYAAFTHGLSHRWLYLVRTVKDISALLSPLSDAINLHFIPALTGQPACSKELRALLALPCRIGGLNIPDPSNMSSLQFSASFRITAPLAALIVQQEERYDIKDKVRQVKETIRKEKLMHQNEALAAIYGSPSSSVRRCIDLSGEKGSSNWLTVLP